MQTMQRIIDGFFNLAMTPLGWLIILGVVIFAIAILKGPKGAR